MQVFQSFWKRWHFRARRSQPAGELKPGQPTAHLIYRTYQALSTASIETLWQTLTNLAEMSVWHPLIASTNVPRGLTAKPGLIVSVSPRWLPIPVRIFVERVSPNELISIRLFPIPGLEERVVYRLESTVWGTQISYSVCLRGWLSPVAWSVLQPYASKVAAAIAQAAEDTAASALPSQRSGFEVW
ncbi:MAG: SRPBCC family protein [Cyanobacteria bacterium P01_F01_bin.56]